MADSRAKPFDALAMRAPAWPNSAMVRKKPAAPSRDVSLRLFRWSMLALAGVVGGMMLGNMVAGSSAQRGAGEPASYSRLSANPDALVSQVENTAPCLGCADSYGVAVRLRAEREDRMSDEFRELGAVDDSPPYHDDLADDYRFGGRFPDPALEPMTDQEPTKPVQDTPRLEKDAAIIEDAAPSPIG